MGEGIELLTRNPPVPIWVYSSGAEHGSSALVGSHTLARGGMATKPDLRCVLDIDFFIDTASRGKVVERTWNVQVTSISMMPEIKNIYTRTMSVV
jgi:hypothetical protein